MSQPLSLSIQFTARHWNETPFHELTGAGKLSRASIENALSGDLEGTGVLEYLLAYPAAGQDVPFVGYERIAGQAGGREGSFVIRHDGVYSPTAGVSGQLAVVAGSGTGAFAGVGGQGRIEAQPGAHGGVYRLELAWAA